MNIFVVDRDPIVAARMLNDKHVVKQTLETTQLLSGAQIMMGREVTYKLTHKNHPCSQWVRSSRENYIWTWEHGKALCSEYTHRYGKVHKCEGYYLTELSGYDIFPSNGLEEFVQCMPDLYRDLDPVKAYQDYYNGEKAYFSKWTKRTPPNWFRP